MSRSSWKGSFIDKNVLKLNNTKKSFIKIMSRRSTIPEYLLRKEVYIHNGNSFKSLLIDDACIGYKFGEFSFTRNFTPKPEDQRKRRRSLRRKKKSK